MQSVPLSGTLSPSSLNIHQIVQAPDHVRIPWGDLCLGRPIEHIMVPFMRVSP